MIVPGSIAAPDTMIVRTTRKSRGIRCLLASALLVALGSVGCNGLQNSPASRDPQPAQQPAEGTESTIPDDVSYSIIEESTLHDIKRSLDVRLNKRVSEDTIRAIALELKARDPQAYERTFIVYYLPEMTVGAGGWATSHFDPDLEVRILGLTAKEHEELTAEPTSAKRDIVGRWLYEGPLVSHRVTIFREDGELILEQRFQDGSSLRNPLVASQSPLGRRFDAVEDSEFGDHWILGTDENLQLRDNEGLIATARKIK